MPLNIETDIDQEIELKDLAEWLSTEKLDMTDVGEMATAAPWLRKLSNNKKFLSDLALTELKQGYSNSTSNSNYSAQVMMLHLPQDASDQYYIRANFWPSVKDQPVKAAGTEPFFYHRPHDHNFNFLTVGYFGPGYWSNYYEYDPESVEGYPGEKVLSLKFIEKKNLSEGHVMLYRASIDIHEQLPADSMSISLNIMENTSRARLVSQYSFDLDRARIQRIINISPAPCIFGVTAGLGGENGKDVLNEIIKYSRDPFMRFSAHKALAGVYSDANSYCETMSAALSDDSPFVAKWAAQHIEQVCHDTQ